MSLRLERETQTPRGFRRRVRTDHTLSIQASVLGVPILVFAFVDPVSWLSKAPFDVVWGWFVASPNIWVASAGVLLIGVTVITTQVHVLSAARMPVSSFVAAADAVRSSVFGRTPGEKTLMEIRQQTSRLDAVPAEAWFPYASGCFLGVTREAPLTVAIPRRLRDGRWNIRLGRVRFTSDEKADLG